MKFIDDGKFCDGKKILVFGRNATAAMFLEAFEINPESIIGFVESEKSMEKILGGGGN